jgi:SWI/SNF-related matrix-associated actin-dependent regulator of chromatin subfamily A member 5
LNRYRNQINYKVPKDPAKEVWTDEDEADRKAEQEKINVAIPLTDEEIQEKEDLMKQGFENWNKRDFTQFIKACEKYVVPRFTACWLNFGTFS